ncbi:4'-phosphopantetheinyl transferase family protein [Marilutibacter chinensis]|uniref:Enterobactin synthase component D n=1 Tax=Marilutibacter chinensis TaxID=2912247 RepID=A0ABS9HW10_9GAMM|nr:4'-phosphopantetheinyl transferase superfamily protein [Lysobacter chinensis]MCF7222335.1 4'-phosphopantetheinyl transferase superfamily protein [Lysobacter chinensis]
MTTPLDAGPAPHAGSAPQGHYRDRPAAELEPLLSDSAPGLSWHAVGFDGECPFAMFEGHLPADMRRISPKRITEFLAGRYCAERALALAGGRAGQWLPRGEDRLPVWPPGWTGSISHANGIAASAVVASAPGRVLGLDVERWVEPDQAMQIQAMIATPGELSLLSMLPPERALIVLFSAKEALFKALYRQAQRFMEFSAARLVGVADGELMLQLSERWSEDWARGMLLPVRYLPMDTHVFTAVSIDSGVAPASSASARDRP